MDVKSLKLNLHSTLSNSNSLWIVKMFELAKVRILENRILEVFW